MKKSKSVKSIVSVVLISLILSLGTAGVQADVRTESIPGNVYILDEKNSYDIEGEGVTKAAISSSSALGKLSISAELKKTSLKNGFDAFVVDSGNVSISYRFDEKKLNAAESDWHIVSDGGKEISNIPLKSKIESGAIIVETSLDGEKWIGPDVEKTNIFTKDSSLSDAPFYTTKDIQLVNGAVAVVIIIVVLVAVGAGGYFYSAKIRKSNSITPVDKKPEGDLPGEELSPVVEPVEGDEHAAAEEIPIVNEPSEVEESPVVEETPEVEEQAETEETVEDAEVK